ncbi:two-component system response regulator [Pseudomonas syringae]|jgi:two-component system response regulator FixJ|uniref:response regulator transcription factor n=1 Tax=Pseudomonas syringae TaxID=317 RepID=UPI000C1C9DF9|nr:response regulator [Pseudomonas syringae]PIO94754.1 two-component system response regulator [Pseudomonas syringae]POP80795.1 DNA-binding response regulator [Pseudomonas syringae]
MIKQNTFNNANAPVTVHVVDDDLDTRDLLCQLLTPAGYPVQSHNSGTAFLQAYDGLAGCVMLDLVMPGMRGEALLDEIVRRKFNVVVIVMTAHATIESAIHITRAGAIGFLQKPFDGDQLLKTLEKISLQAQTVFARRALVDDYRLRLESLTSREREVMDLMLAAMTSQEIATQLGNSKKTVDIHRARVMQKMGASTITELIMGWTLLFHGPVI